MMRLYDKVNKERRDANLLASSPYPAPRIEGCERPDSNERARRVVWQDGGSIDRAAIVNAVMYGNKVDITSTTLRNARPHCLKLNDKEYLVLSTGEVKQYNTQERKQEANARAASVTLRRLIEHNFCGSAAEVLLTVTYKECMRDARRGVRDTNILLQWARRYLKAEIAYIAVTELQKRGAYHYHILIKRVDGKKLILPYDEVKKHWQYGSVNVKRVHDKMPRYLCGYFSSTDKAKRILQIDKDTKIYRVSQNILRPQKVRCICSELDDYTKVLASRTGAVWTEKGLVGHIIKQTRERSPLGIPLRN